MTNEDKILSLLETLSKDLAELRVGQAEFRADLVDLRDDVASLKRGQLKLEHGQAQIRKDIKDLNLYSRASFEE
ncbi:MAG: hypothetical protein LBK41_09620 [Clostridiales bacterium]|jgi:hypothetical protein|nr:hypothetical protein [Clostridiales bacterium]